MNIISFIWVFFLISSLWPWYKARQLQRRRLQAIVTFQRMRKARLITLIHRQETMSLLGIPIMRHIDIEDSEHILRAVRLTPDNMPIDIVLHTPGGLVLATEQIAEAIRKHPAKVTVFIPHYAMSGGTMLALSADEIVMDGNAVLGPVDPQLGQYPAVSILQAVARKDTNLVKDETLILADIAEKAMRQVYDFVYNLVRQQMDEDGARNVASTLTEGRFTHDYPLTCDYLRSLGLRVSCEMPLAVYDLMALYPQLPGRRPSVQYIPVDNGRW